MRKTGIWKLFATYALIESLPTSAGLAGGKTEASSDQYDRIYSRSRLSAAFDHSA